MGMVRRGMDVRRVGLHLVVVFCLSAGAFGAVCRTGVSAFRLDSQDQAASSTTVHRKTGESSSQTVRHTRIAEPDSSSPLLAHAEGLIQKQDFAAAEPLLQQVVAADSGNYVAWFDLGFTENGLGKTDASIAAYRKSVAAKPDVFESNLNLGIQLARTGQPEAEQFLRSATGLTPTGNIAEGKARAWLSLAHVIEASQPDQAIEAYQHAAALQPTDAEPHLNAGLLLEKYGKFSEAENEYKQAMTLDATSSDAMVALANLYMRGRRYPEAEQFLRKVTKARPQDVAARVQLARVLAADNKNGDAVSEFESAIKLDPTNAGVQRELADLCTKTGKYDQAEAVYRKLLEASPNDAGLHSDLGQSLLRQKKFPDAEREFLAAVKLKPDFGEGYGDLAFAASQNNEYGLTLKALETRAKFLPENPPTLFMRASAYDHLKDFKHAAENYRLFLSTANGKYPDQEWQAKHRLIAIEPKK
jgi:tetratricopeptide (TPR) repeat protein